MSPPGQLNVTGEEHDYMTGVPLTSLSLTSAGPSVLSSNPNIVIYISEELTIDFPAVSFVLHSLFHYLCVAFLS